MGSYEINEANLKYVADASSISLEDLQGTPAFAKVASSMPAYLSLVGSIGDVSLRDVGSITTVLKNLLEAGVADVQGVLEAADPSVVVTSWTQVGESQRPSVMASRRVALDFDLIEDYVSEFGLDGPMATFLTAIDGMPQYSAEDPQQSRRRAMAVRIINSPMPLPSKLRLFESLDIQSPLDVQNLTQIDADDVAGYLRAGVLSDDLSTWEGLKVWPTKEAFLEHAQSVEDWIGVTPLSDSDVESLFASEGAGLDRVKRRVFETLNLASLGPESWDEVLDFADSVGLLMKDDVLLRAVSAGADRERLLRAFVKVDRVPPVIEALLNGLGGDYAKVARPGHGQFKFPKDDLHRALGDKLERAEIVNIDDSNETLKFNLRHPKLDG